jgi:hypothetical protein
MAPFLHSPYIVNPLVKPRVRLLQPPRRPLLQPWQPCSSPLRHRGLFAPLLVPAGCASLLSHGVVTCYLQISTAGLHSPICLGFWVPSVWCFSGRCTIASGSEGRRRQVSTSVSADGEGELQAPFDLRHCDQDNAAPAMRGSRHQRIACEKARWIFWLEKGESK